MTITEDNYNHLDAVFSNNESDIVETMDGTAGRVSVFFNEKELVELLDGEFNRQRQSELVERFKRNLQSIIEQSKL